MAKTIKPNINDIVEINEPVFKRVKTGKVVELKDDEFDYKILSSVEDGKHFYPKDRIDWCRYSQNWKVIK